MTVCIRYIIQVIEFSGFQYIFQSCMIITNSTTFSPISERIPIPICHHLPCFSLSRPGDQHSIFCLWILTHWTFCMNGSILHVALGWREVGVAIKEHMRNPCCNSHVLYFDYVNVNILVVILNSSFPRYYPQWQLGKGYIVIILYLYLQLYVVNLKLSQNKLVKKKKKET